MLNMLKKYPEFLYSCFEVIFTYGIHIRIYIFKPIKLPCFCLYSAPTSLLNILKLFVCFQINLEVKGLIQKCDTHILTKKKKE